MKIEPLIEQDNQQIQNYIITKIKEYINYKNLEPGDKLPSERSLSEKLDVSRSNVRQAIQKLEYYGLLESRSQSGTFVANIGIIALNGMINDILNLKPPDFKSLVETRIFLELETVRLAAIRRTEESLERIKRSHDAYEVKVISGHDAVQEDLLFHLEIAKASNNSSMEMVMLIITPEIITNFERYHICDKNQSLMAIKEHLDIYNAIKNKDSEMAKSKMKEHFRILYQYCYNTQKNIVHEN